MAWPCDDLMQLGTTTICDDGFYFLDLRCPNRSTEDQNLFDGYCCRDAKRSRGSRGEAYSVEASQL